MPARRRHFFIPRLVNNSLKVPEEEKSKVTFCYLPSVPL